jgi:hypothetical protein
VPFRSIDTLESWLEEFASLGYPTADSARVIAQDGADDVDTGLVVFQFVNSPTLAYLQPEPPSLEWVITIEGRDAAIPMKPSTAMNVAYEFSVVSALGTFLQAKSRVWMADHEPS